MLKFHRPTFDELSFREKMLADGETMSYNRVYGGTIAFPREKWAAWYEKWISDPQGKRFYRYVKENGRFAAEATVAPPCGCSAMRQVREVFACFVTRLVQRIRRRSFFQLWFF